MILYIYTRRQQTLYNLQKYDEAEEKVFDISENFGSFVNWTARSFIVLSDVYVAKDNVFQAKETLKSVIDNYPKDDNESEEIIRMAQEKLDVLENVE